MTRTHAISRAVRRALLTSAVATAGLTLQPAIAQDQDQDDDAQTVVVTGSRIQRQDYVANSPLTTVSSEELGNQQDITLDTFLNTLPQVNPAGTTTSNNPGNNGQSNIDLRGLGANRNLVLIDGRRAMVSASDMTVDLNTIPQAMLEAVDVITGGAGAVYGADAVAGAVNLRLKRNFEGVETRLGWSNATSDWDAQEYSANLLLGSNFSEDRGNVIFGFEYAEREGLIKSQRDFAAVATATTSFLPEGLYFDNVNAPSQAAVDAVFASYGAAPGSVRAGNALMGFNLDGTLFSRGVFNNSQDMVNFRYPNDLAVNTTLSPDVYSYNFDSVNILTLPLDRRTMLTKVDYGFENGVETFAQFGYTEYNSAAALAPTPIPTVSGTAPGANGPTQFSSPFIAAGATVANLMVIPRSNPFIPQDLNVLLDSRTGDDARLVGSGAAEPFVMRQRTLDLGLRQSSFENTVVQYLVGASGPLLGDNWKWETYASEGRTEIDERQQGNVDTQRLQTLLEASDGGDSLCAGGFNPFGRQAISAECATYLQVTNTLVNTFKQQIVQGFVTGNVTDLPAGPLSAVVGVEYRGFRYDFDPGSASGPVSGFNAQSAAGGTNKFNDVFTEVLVPVVENFEVTVGYRYSDSEFKDRTTGMSSGSTDDAYKLEMSWAPIETTRLRASYQKAVRAPNFTELFDGTAANPQYFDPCSVTTNARNGASGAQLRSLCLQAGGGFPSDQAVDGYVQTPGTQLQLIQGGSLNLTPESADTMTLGAVFTSPWTGALERLRASVDYYRVDIDDPILRVDPNLYVADCYNYYGNNPGFDPNHPSCAGLIRSNDILAVVDPTTDSGDFQLLNGGTLKTDGIDMRVDWGIDAGPGTVSTSLLFNYLLSWKQKATDTLPEQDFAGTVTFFGAGDGLGQSFPELKAYWQTRYTFGTLSFDARARYIDGMDNRTAVLYPGEDSQFTGVGSVTYWDFGANWNFTEGSTVRIGVNNAFDKQPPTYRPNVQSGTDPSLYDVIGRRAFAQIMMKF